MTYKTPAGFEYDSFKETQEADQPEEEIVTKSDRIVEIKKQIAALEHELAVLDINRSSERGLLRLETECGRRGGVKNPYILKMKYAPIGQKCQMKRIFEGPDAKSAVEFLEKMSEEFSSFADDLKKMVKEI